MSARELLRAAAQHDDGAPDPALAAALGCGDEDRIGAVLAGTRVFAAIEARLVPGDVALGPAVEKESEMALVAVRAQSGATALPVFSGVGALVGWRPGARPVAVNGAAVAAEAVRLGHEAVLVDPGTAVAAVIDGPLLAALAAGPPGVRPDGAASVVPARSVPGLPDRALRRALRPWRGIAAFYPLELVDGTSRRPALGVVPFPGAPPDLFARVTAAVGGVATGPVDVVPLDPQTAERLRAGS